jgi:hypothetical protein
MIFITALGTGILECHKSPWEVLSSGLTTLKSNRMAPGIILIGIGVPFPSTKIQLNTFRKNGTSILVFFFFFQNKHS